MCQPLLPSKAALWPAKLAPLPPLHPTVSYPLVFHYPYISSELPRHCYYTTHTCMHASSSCQLLWLVFNEKAMRQMDKWAEQKSKARAGDMSSQVGKSMPDEHRFFRYTVGRQCGSAQAQCATTSLLGCQQCRCASQGASAAGVLSLQQLAGVAVAALPPILCLAVCAAVAHCFAARAPLGLQGPASCQVGACPAFQQGHTKSRVEPSAGSGSRTG